MKRSTINTAIDWAKDLLKQESWFLPEYAYWDMDTWESNADTARAIDKIMLGWDVTDYGINDYDRVGGVLYTIRNGTLDKKHGVPYAEKVILLKPGQCLPCHFHFSKTEDIINRRGGKLWLRLNNAKEDDSIDTSTDVEVYIDGVLHRIPAGELLFLENGQSITITPRLYHSFGAMENDSIIVGEVSSINDDNVDNNFNPPLPRFVQIEEDEPARYVLCNEYGKLFNL